MGILVPPENAAEAAVVAGLQVIPVRNLREAVGFLKGEVKIASTKLDAVPLRLRKIAAAVAGSLGESAAALPATIAGMKMKFFPLFRDEGEVIAAWCQAQLIKYLDGKLELKGGSKEDRIAAREWISMFLNDVVVRDSSGHYKSDPRM